MKALGHLELHRSEIEALCSKYGVRKLRVFGSSVREDWSETKSDIDLIAEFGPAPEGINRFEQQFGLQVELEALLGRKVDLVDWAAAKKPIFRQVAESQAQDWYAA